MPPMGQRPACAQVYILDGESQVAARRGLPWGSRLDVGILSDLTDMLMAHNPFVQHFRTAADDNSPELHLRIVPGFASPLHAIAVGCSFIFCNLLETLPTRSVVIPSTSYPFALTNENTPPFFLKHLKRGAHHLPPVPTVLL